MATSSVAVLGHSGSEFKVEPANKGDMVPRNNFVFGRGFNAWRACWGLSCPTGARPSGFKYLSCPFSQF